MADTISKIAEQELAIVEKMWVEFVNLPVPPDALILSWLAASSLSAVQYAVERTGVKVRWAKRNGEPLKNAASYCQGILRNTVGTGDRA